ncbi:MAG: hypothetical protein CME38_01880 [Haliea sp.]|nr:hypothetical protein [Haliea sp.]
MYWSHVGAKTYSFKSTISFKEEDPASVLFALPDADNHNLDISLGEWADHYSQFDNWVRLNALVGITGYLEVFLKTITRAALESDPGILHGSSRAVDGVRFLKTNVKYSMKDHADDIAIGDWNQRIAKYERLFGTAPPSMKGSVAKLEDLRRTRNGVTHTFGRASDDYESIIDANSKPQRNVSEEKLVKTLALIGRIAKEIESDLAPNVGDYETIYFYHQWDKAFDSNYQTELMVLKKQVGQIHGRSMGNQYFQELISFYKAV